MRISKTCSKTQSLSIIASLRRVKHFSGNILRFHLRVSSLQLITFLISWKPIYTHTYLFSSIIQLSAVLARNWRVSPFFRWYSANIFPNFDWKWLITSSRLRRPAKTIHVTLKGFRHFSCPFPKSFKLMYWHKF